MLVWIQALMLVWIVIVAACAIMGLFVLVKMRRERAHHNGLPAPKRPGKAKENAYHHPSINPGGKASS